MTDEHVPAGATVKLTRVDGKLRVGSNARIQAAADGQVVVSDGVLFEGSATVECDLECHDLTVERSGRLRMLGNLTVHGTLDVSNAIEVSGAVAADLVDIGGHVKAETISCKRMRVGGTAEVRQKLRAESVDVGGKIQVRGLLDLGDLQVGGKAEVGGGAVTGTISAGGKFESTGPLQFGELQVYGVASLSGGSKGKKLVLSGKLDSKGDLSCEQLQVHGVAWVGGDCRAGSLVVSGKLGVNGSLTASDSLEGSGVTEVAERLMTGTARVNGRFTAKAAVITRDAVVSGSIETAEGLKAGSVIVKSGSRCGGPLVAQTVEVGRSGPGLTSHVFGQRIRAIVGTSQVEDVYAGTVVLGEGSRAGRVFANSAELSSGCNVEEVTYVNELKLGEHVRIERSVRKVERLPEPPI